MKYSNLKTDYRIGDKVKIKSTDEVGFIKEIIITKECLFYNIELNSLLKRFKSYQIKYR